MSQHSASTSNQTAIPAAGQDLRTAVEQTRLSGFTKTWTHLLAAALAVAVAATTDGDVTRLECAQILAVVITAGITWLVPGTAAKVLVSLVLAAAGAVAPYLWLGWSGLTGDNVMLMVIAVLGAVSSALLPNVSPAPLEPAVTAAPPTVLLDWSPVVAALATPQRADDVRQPHEQPAPPTPAQEPVVATTSQQEQPAPSVPPVAAKTVSAMARLRRPRAEAPPLQSLEPLPPVQLDQDDDEPAPAPPRSSVRSSYRPPGSGATGVLPTQPAAGTSGEEPGPRGYDFGRP